MHWIVLEPLLILLQQSAVSLRQQGFLVVIFHWGNFSKVVCFSHMRNFSQFKGESQWHGQNGPMVNQPMLTSYIGLTACLLNRSFICDTPQSSWWTADTRRVDTIRESAWHRASLQPGGVYSVRYRQCPAVAPGIRLQTETDDHFNHMWRYGQPTDPLHTPPHRDNDTSSIQGALPHNSPPALFISLIT